MKFLADNSSPFYNRTNVTHLFKYYSSQPLHLLLQQHLVTFLFPLLFKRVKIVAPLYFTFYHTLCIIAKVQVDVRSVNMAIDGLNASIKTLNKHSAQLNIKPSHLQDWVVILFLAARVLHFVAIETNNASFCCKKRTTLSESSLKHISVLNKRSISVQSKSSGNVRNQDKVSQAFTESLWYETSKKNRFILLLETNNAFRIFMVLSETNSALLKKISRFIA